MKASRILIGNGQSHAELVIAMTLPVVKKVWIDIHHLSFLKEAL
jgi:hypothetical protein